MSFLVDHIFSRWTFFVELLSNRDAMGNIIAGYVGWQPDSTNLNVRKASSPGARFFGKRRLSDLTSQNADVHPTKIIRLDTSKYLHQKLFVEGRKSDVTIVALGHEWHLHKIYLEQCDYFRCLFSGNWSDSTANRYELEIEDRRITFEGREFEWMSLIDEVFQD